ncbi:MAG: DEAD/DEAH box helicase [Fluviicola sp.]|jgi:superfamily II DNA/RNA helicase|nr:DEAD/DEAH box helicase [Fluviicola sp.]
MSLNKYSEVLQKSMPLAGLEHPTEIQNLCFSKYKQGTDFIAIAPKGSGKSTSIVTGVIQRLEKATEDDAPRAIIFVENKERALEMEALFLKLARRTDLRVVVVYDKGIKVRQRIDLYQGSDIVIGTPKRIQEMYHQNGINTANVKLYIIDDAELIMKQGFHTPINRIYESIAKCQSIMYANEYEVRMEKAIDVIMKNPDIIELEEEIEKNEE